ncbi:vacuolar import and degradation protein-domain-containing protein [Schizophyllum fasciatum]
MPSYGLVLPPAPADAPADHRAPPAQVKTCTSCNCALADPAAAPGADAPVCGRCREHARARDHRTQPAQQTPPPDCRQLHHVVPDSPVFPPAQPAAIVQPRATDYEQHDYDAAPHPEADRQPFRAGFPAQGALAQDGRHDGAQAPRHHQKVAQLRINTPAPAPPERSAVSPRRPPAAAAVCDPLVDITYLRVRPQAHHCLYPGATFSGTQKSGRNSYDVNVTIMDVDFDASFLCGYLSIRGLTDDWPELTTYFDAEIVGSRHGFLTRKWNASEQDDMMHWQRFPAFKAVKHELQKPSYTLPDRDRGAIFMRWKERFLVPDHRVQDINGASFAGFYYVCVDFNSPTHRAAAHMPDMPEDVMEEDGEGGGKPEPPPMARRRRDSMGVGARRRSSSRRPGPALAGPGTATMNGFYYHQNSEPYQQLSLSHVPQVGTSSFEFC